MTRTPDRLELLTQVLEQANELRWGHTALRVRMDDWTMGYPTGGSGGGSTSAADPTSRVVVDTLDAEEKARKKAQEEGKKSTPPADAVTDFWRSYDALLEKAWRNISQLYGLHREHMDPKAPILKSTDPGCELHGKLSTPQRPVWVATYAHIDLVTKKKGGKEETRRIPACWFCWQWNRKTGTPPTMEVVQANHEGRRQRVPA